MAYLLFAPIAIAKLDDWRRNKTDDVYRWYSDENMPVVLRRSTVVMNEHEISMSDPIKIKGRVDQVYRLPNGTLVLVDTKTRRTHRVFSSDIVQLSIYAMIMAYAYRGRTSRIAYVRTVIRTPVNRSVRYHPIRLIPFPTLIHWLRTNRA